MAKKPKPLTPDEAIELLRKHALEYRPSQRGRDAVNKLFKDLGHPELVCLPTPGWPDGKTYAEAFGGDVEEGI